MFGPRGRAWTSSRWPAAIDPIELRIRNEPDVDPETGKPFVQPAASWTACATGAERFGWDGRDPHAGRAPRRRLAGRHRRRLGDVPRHAGCPATPPDRAHRRRAATPCRSAPPTSAPAPGRRSPRSPPTRSACDVDAVDLQIGDTDLPGGLGGGRLVGHSDLGLGDRRCGPGVPRGARRRPARRRRHLGRRRPENERGRELRACTRSAPSSPRSRVHADTGEIRVSRHARGVRRRPDRSTRAPPARSSSAA